ncbi:MAG: hypothetical protein A2822_04085 [Candidatus Staskawiczbacteria bacterium RIFCSPHIGHO2_01_FULL_41_41]|uniref:Uncharacterized protein n=1 Tax=Candidatus Staskawiczbacteria bacterium RIFCSPHIGHO2_01_FULL_41_41 TaxID=1802203 RepID=A0A1G2HWG6_9BACT|nr:MAG: hypothetical protein A2822_04085 [Candidatus Staskawiczbacteria bacterium RIFCSPHIGHO2_01_FULL_41_41]
MTRLILPAQTGCGPARSCAQLPSPITAHLSAENPAQAGTMLFCLRGALLAQYPRFMPTQKAFLGRHLVFPKALCYKKVSPLLICKGGYRDWLW